MNLDSSARNVRGRRCALGGEGSCQERLHAVVPELGDAIEVLGRTPIRGDGVAQGNRGRVHLHVPGKPSTGANDAASGPCTSRQYRWNSASSTSGRRWRQNTSLTTCPRLSSGGV